MAQTMKLLFFLAIAVSQCYSIDTVKNFNPKKYLGRWYQAFASFTVMSTFERNAVCVIADYKLRKEGGISVYNANRVKTVTGPVKNITGYAIVKDKSSPGKLSVYLAGVPFPGDYWIVMVGPQKGTKSYEYAVVTDRFKITLFVLTTDIDKYFKKYDKKVQGFLKANGFTWPWNKPRKTVQSKDCDYKDM